MPRYLHPAEFSNSERVVSERVVKSCGMPRARGLRLIIWGLGFIVYQARQVGVGHGAEQVLLARGGRLLVEMRLRRFRHLRYRGTSLARTRNPLGPYRRPMPRVLEGS